MRGMKWPTPEDLIGLAFEANDRAEFRDEVLRRLLACTGADFALFACADSLPKTEEAPHLDVQVARASRFTYLESSPLMERAFRYLKRCAVAIDTELFRRSEWERLPYVERHQRAYGVKSSLLASWVSRSQEPIVLTLARTDRRFSQKHADAFKRLYKTLVVADSSFGACPPQCPPDELDGLTARQRQIVEYLCRGYSNAEIALACNISPFTVRNHLVTLFDRFGVATRTELAVRLAGK